jgi:hypothetical protein
MLHNISWGQFLSVAIILMAIYYGYLIIAYFRKDIQAAARKKISRKAGTNPPITADSAELPVPGKNPYDTHITTVHELMDDLNNVFNRCADQNLKKTEILMAVQLKLDNYPQLKGTPFQVSINNHIETVTLIKCGVLLETEEIKGLW